MQFEFACSKNAKIFIMIMCVALCYVALHLHRGISTRGAFINTCTCNYITTVPLPRCCDGCICIPVCVYMTTMQSITQSAVQERLVMEEELKKALDRCEELEQSSVPMG